MVKKWFYFLLFLSLHINAAMLDGDLDKTTKSVAASVDRFAILDDSGNLKKPGIVQSASANSSDAMTSANRLLSQFQQSDAQAEKLSDKIEKEVNN